MAHQPKLAASSRANLRTWSRCSAAPTRGAGAELGRSPSEPLIEKPRASAFFGTHLLDMLISERIDTLIVTGCSTSGCIRATCESALQLQLPRAVPREAGGDRSPPAHAANCSISTHATPMSSRSPKRWSISRRWQSPSVPRKSVHRRGLRDVEVASRVAPDAVWLVQHRGDSGRSVCRPHPADSAAVSGRRAES